MGKISLSHIAEELAAKSNLSREAAASFMHAFVETIEKGLQQDGIVKIKGLGTFKLQEMSDRGSVDVNTGERITIKGHRKVTFTPDSTMKELVNRPFAHFEPTELNDGYPDEEESLIVETADSSDANEEQKTEVEEQVIVADVVSEEIAPVDTVAEEVVSEENEIALVVDTMAEKEPESIEVPIETSEVESKGVQDEAEKPLEEDVAVKDDTDSIPAEEAVENVSPVITAENTLEPPKQETLKKRRGCLTWVLMILLLAAVLVVGFSWFTTPIPTSESLRGDAVMEQGEIKVKPNLEEELGAEWESVEKTVEEQLPENGENALVDSVEVKELQTEVEPDPIAPEYTFCITESLQAKDIKDITLADTTDYAIDGTLATHKLNRGETIIQLAKKYYGDKRLWPYIVKHNEMKDYNNVAIGQKINIPVLRNK